MRNKAIFAARIRRFTANSSQHCTVGAQIANVTTHLPSDWAALHCRVERTNRYGPTLQFRAPPDPYQ